MMLQDSPSDVFYFLHSLPHPPTTKYFVEPLIPPLESPSTGLSLFPHRTTKSRGSPFHPPLCQRNIYFISRVDLRLSSPPNLFSPLFWFHPTTMTTTARHGESTRTHPYIPRHPQFVSARNFVCLLVFEPENSVADRNDKLSLQRLRVTVGGHRVKTHRSVVQRKRSCRNRVCMTSGRCYISNSLLEGQEGPMNTLGGF